MIRRIRDAAGRKYLIKFDPLTNPEMASAADVITSKFFYALGYNVPENYVVHFDREQIAIGEGAHVGNFVETKKTRLGRGSKANHLTYLGDAQIGEGVNIGAGIEGHARLHLFRRHVFGRAQNPARGWTAARGYSR